MSHTIASFLYEVVPPGTEDVVRDLFLVQGQRPESLLVIAVLLAAWAASGAMISLMEGFNATYHVPSPDLPAGSAASPCPLVFTTVLPLWGASALMVFGQRAERAAISGLGLSAGRRGLHRLGVAGRASCCVTESHLARWCWSPRWCTPGTEPETDLPHGLSGSGAGHAVVADRDVAFAWYVRHVANYNVLYGGVGAGLALLVWMYVLAVINLFRLRVQRRARTIRGARDNLK